MRKKGFTLVELLAVIVILAVILAIAIPSVNGIIDNSKRNSFADNAKMIIKAIDLKRNSDTTFDPTTVTETNIQSLLGVDPSNIQTLTVSLASGKTNISMIGKGKWPLLQANGDYNTVAVTDYVPVTLTYIYNEGQNASAWTNGYANPGTYVSITKTKEAGDLYTSLTSTDDYSPAAAVWVTGSKVNISGKSTLNFEFSRNGPVNDILIAIDSTNQMTNPYFTDPLTIMVHGSNYTADTRYTISLDVSGLSNNYYIKFSTSIIPLASASTKLYKVWLQ